MSKNRRHTKRQVKPRWLGTKADERRKVYRRSIRSRSKQSLRDGKYDNLPISTKHCESET